MTGPEPTGAGPTRPAPGESGTTSAPAASAGAGPSTSPSASVEAADASDDTGSVLGPLLAGGVLTVLLAATARQVLRRRGTAA